MDQIEGSNREDIASAVMEVLESQQEEADRWKERRAKRRSRTNRQVPLGIALGVAWGVMGWLWISRPAAIFGTVAPAPMSMAEQNAATRYAMYLERGRIDYFQSSRGRLPRSLSEAGDVEEGVTYDVRGGEYILRAQSGDPTLRLSSRMAADSFLGNALDRLRARGGGGQ